MKPETDEIQENVARLSDKELTKLLKRMLKTEGNELRGAEAVQHILTLLAIHSEMKKRESVRRRLVRNTRESVGLIR